MRVAALAVICGCISACVTATPSDDHSLACAVFEEVITTASTTGLLPELRGRDNERLDTITTARLPEGGYMCPAGVYRETVGEQVLFDFGFSGDRRYASVGLGSATFGKRLLLRRTQDGWTVVGSRILWIA